MLLKVISQGPICHIWGFWPEFGSLIFDTLNCKVFRFVLKILPPRFSATWRVPLIIFITESCLRSCSVNFEMSKFVFFCNTEKMFPVFTLGPRGVVSCTWLLLYHVIRLKTRTPRGPQGPFFKQRGPNTARTQQLDRFSVNTKMLRAKSLKF